MEEDGIWYLNFSKIKKIDIHKKNKGIRNKGIEN